MLQINLNIIMLSLENYDLHINDDDAKSLP